MSISANESVTTEVFSFGKQADVDDFIFRATMDQAASKHVSSITYIQRHTAELGDHFIVYVKTGPSGSLNSQVETGLRCRLKSYAEDCRTYVR